MTIRELAIALLCGTCLSAPVFAQSRNQAPGTGNGANTNLSNVTLPTSVSPGLVTGLGPWSPMIHEGQGGGFADVTGVGCPHQTLWADQQIFGCSDWIQFYSVDPSEHTIVTLANVGGQHPAAGDVIEIDWVVWASGGGSSTTYNLTYTIQAGDIGADDGATYLNAVVGLGNCINGGTAFCGGNTGFYNALKGYKAFSFESGGTGTIAYQTTVAGQSSRIDASSAKTTFDQPWTSNGAQNCGGTTGGCNITGVANAHTTVTVAVDGTDGGPTMALKRYPGHFPYSGDRGPQFVILGGSSNTSFGNQLFGIATTYTGTHGVSSTSDTIIASLNRLYQGATATFLNISNGMYTPTASGGDKGSETFNALALYDNGNRVQSAAGVRIQTSGDVSSSDSTTAIPFPDLAQTLVAGGHYHCRGRVHFTAAPTTSNGAKLSLTASGGLSATTISTSAVAYNTGTPGTVASMGNVQSFGNAFINAKVAMTDVVIDSIINVNVGGTMNLNLFENTASGTITVGNGNATLDCLRAN